MSVLGPCLLHFVVFLHVASLLSTLGVAEAARCLEAVNFSNLDRYKLFSHLTYYILDYKKRIKNQLLLITTHQDLKTDVEKAIYLKRAWKKNIHNRLSLSNSVLVISFPMMPKGEKHCVGGSVVIWRNNFQAFFGGAGGRGHQHQHQSFHFGVAQAARCLGVVHFPIWIDTKSLDT